MAASQRLRLGHEPNLHFSRFSSIEMSDRKSASCVELSSFEPKMDLSIHREAGYIETVENILQNPLKCGYLQEFCNMEYSGENMKFIIAVGKFQDSLKVDFEAWQRSTSWREIDSVIDIECCPMNLFMN